MAVGIRYLVSPSGFDDIGSVLTDLGEGFEHREISWDDLSSQAVPSECHVLFLNCSPECKDERDITHIREFVKRGGSLYASDWAGHIVEEAFPGKLEFDSFTTASEERCDIVDPGLREMLGATIDVHFDLPGWLKVSSYDTTVRTYVMSGKSPLITSFNVGNGHVIFTSFHNEKQVSEAEHKLLRFLVLRPVLAKAAATASTLSKARQFEVGKEILSTLAPNGVDRYVHPSPGNEALLFLLQWEGQGSTRMSVTDPSGKTLFTEQATRPPLQFEVSHAATGNWACEVAAAGLSLGNLPYVLTLSTRVGGAAPVLKPVAPPRWTGQGSYACQWGSLHPGCLIILLDRSESMHEPFSLKQAGSGKRKCDMVAAVVNNLLNEMVQSNTVGLQVKPRAEIAVIGYEGATARSALGGSLASKSVVTLPELMENPLRVESRNRTEIDENGQAFEVRVEFPVWVEAAVGSATPMCAALSRAAELVSDWADTHPDHYPPVVVNVTDGVSTDGDPRVLAEHLRKIGTSDGPALLFNCYLTNRSVQPVAFPVSASELPPDPSGVHRTLFDMSSEVPIRARQNMEGATGEALRAGARGLILNGDAASLRQMFVFATVAASRAVDPNR